MFDYRMPQVVLFINNVEVTYEELERRVSLIFLKEDKLNFKDNTIV